MEVLHFAFYLGLLIFLVMILYKGIKIATTPVHLRWELYPVPHEKGKSKYGGSYLEEANWWEKPLEKDLLSELSTMVQEIVFLKGVWEHNRSLWFGSFPFHYALYLYIVGTVLLLIGLIFGVSPESLSQATIFPTILNILFWASAILGVLGSVLLLLKRIFDPDLAAYANASHYFNLILIGAMYLTLLLWFASGGGLTQLAGFYSAVFTFNILPELNLSSYIHLYLLSFFMFYLPFTHMTHFFVKYFTYHKVRWDDEPNSPNTKLREKLMKQLNFPVSWSAPHIGADGRKTWVVLASELPFKKEGNNG